MGRRRRITGGPYHEAYDAIANMEQRVVRALAPLDGLCTDDFVDWCFPADALKLLRAAGPVANIYSMDGTSMDVPHTDGSAIDTTLRFSFQQLKCVEPCMLAKLQPSTKAEQCVAYVQSVHELHLDHQKLRGIVEHFNSRDLTPGAARYYFPSMQSLLPKDHKFFSVSGDRHKPIDMPPRLAELLREAPEIIARGLLCPDHLDYKAELQLLAINVENSLRFRVF